MFDILEEIFEVKVKLSECFKVLFLRDTSVLFDPDFVIISEPQLRQLRPIVDILEEDTLPDLELLESFEVQMFHSKFSCEPVFGEVMSDVDFVDSFEILLVKRRRITTKITFITTIFATILVSELTTFRRSK